MTARPHRQIPIPAWAMALLLAVLPACGERAGSARLRVALPAAADVGAVVVTVGPGRGEPFTPFTVRLSRSGAEWTAFVRGIPAGTGRRFDVAALGAGGVPVYIGAVEADVAGGGQLGMVVLLEEAPAAVVSAADSGPVVTFVWAAEAVARPGQAVEVGASAHDPDPGAQLTLRWEATCGTFAEPAAATTSWLAPLAPGTCELHLVAASSGVAVRVSFDVAVAPAQP